MNNNLAVQRFDSLYAERQASIDQVWDELTRYVLPFRGELYISQDNEHQIDWEKREIYDSTAIVAASQLASSMQANITSFSQKWFDLSFSDSKLNSEDAPREWLEEVGNKIYNELSQSNFDVEISEVYLDLSVYGTAILFQEEVEGESLFTLTPLRDMVFTENAKKQIDTVYRILRMTSIQMTDKFGEDCPQEIKDKAATVAGATDKEEVIFCIFNRTKVSKDIDLSKPVKPELLPIGYKYILKKTKETIGEEGGYYEMPAYVSRWSKSGGSKWGASPAMNVLATIVRLNTWEEVALSSASKVIDPTILVEDGVVFGDINLKNGGVTTVSDINGFKVLENGARFDVAESVKMNMRDMIKTALFQNQLELKESPAMTATEVNVRYELMQRLLGPVVARLKTDLLDPIIHRTYMILLRRGEIPEVEGIDIADIDIEYNGVLPRAQKSTQAQSIIEFLRQAGEMAEVFPEARDIVDVDASMRLLATLNGVPAKSLRAQEQIDAKREAEAEAQAEQQKLEQAQQAGDAMQSIGRGAGELGVEMGGEQ